MGNAEPSMNPSTARAIQLVGLDVDGVLTDGGPYLGDVGGTTLDFKRYDIQDALGIFLLRQAGIKVAVVTGRVAEGVKLPCAELRMADVAPGAAARRLPAFLEMSARLGVHLRQSAFIGDDLPDMGIMRVVGLPVAVANAVPEIRAAAQVRLERHGGR